MSGDIKLTAWGSILWVTCELVTVAFHIIGDSVCVVRMLLIMGVCVRSCNPPAGSLDPLLTFGIGWAISHSLDVLVDFCCHSVCSSCLFEIRFLKRY